MPAFKIGSMDAPSEVCLRTDGVDFRTHIEEYPMAMKGGQNMMPGRTTILRGIPTNE